MSYHVYGIGNALVDLDYEVNDDFLNQQDIEKGLMTLIDESQQQALFSALNDQFGMTTRTGGGSAANTTVAVSQFGGNAFYACKVADDESGHFYRENLAESGVTTRLESLSSDGITGKCMVMTTPDTERTMNTFLGITTDFSVDEIDMDELKKADYIYVEGYLVTSDVSRAAVIEARKVAAANGVKTAVTFSDPSMVTYFKEGMQEMIGDGVDILFSNEEEALVFSGKDNLDDAVTELNKLCSTLVVTRGADGALVLENGKQTDIAPIAVKAVDANGAGDMFAGAYMYGVTHGFDAQRAGDLASEAAATIVSKFGSRLGADDIKTLTDKHC